MCGIEKLYIVFNFLNWPHTWHCLMGLYYCSLYGNKQSFFKKSLEISVNVIDTGDVSLHLDQHTCQGRSDPIKSYREYSYTLYFWHSNSRLEFNFSFFASACYPLGSKITFLWGQRSHSYEIKFKHLWCMFTLTIPVSRHQATILRRYKKLHLHLQVKLEKRS